MFLRTTATALTVAAMLVIGCEPSDTDTTVDPTLTTPDTPVERTYDAPDTTTTTPPADVVPEGPATPPGSPSTRSEPLGATPGQPSSVESDRESTVDDPAVEEVPADSPDPE